MLSRELPLEPPADKNWFGHFLGRVYSFNTTHPLTAWLDSALFGQQAALGRLCYFCEAALAPRDRLAVDYLTEWRNDNKIDQIIDAWADGQKDAQESSREGWGR